MPRRFRQFPTPFTAWWHYRRRVRSARLCGLLTALLLPGIAALLHGFPHRASWQSEGDAPRFTAVPYSAPENATEQPQQEQPAPRPALRAPQAPPPAMLTFATAEILPAPAEEPQAELPTDDALATLDLASPLEDTEEVPPVRPAARPNTRPQASATTAAATPAKRTPPAYQDAPQPPYPAALRARRIGGSVGVRIAVSAEGKPTEVSIISPSGYAELDRSAKNWILARWRFRPAELDGHPIAAHVQTRIDYLPDK